MYQETLTTLNTNTHVAPGRPTGGVTAGVQRLELTLRKISDQSAGSIQSVPLSSACTSGCFSSISSIKAQGNDLNLVDEAQIEQVIRLHDKALSVMGQDGVVWSAIAKGIELGLNK
jgi:hypothetical protein